MPIGGAQLNNGSLGITTAVARSFHGYMLREVPCCQIVQSALRCPCLSTGWRTDRWWPHSPQCTTFQLLLIDLCCCVCDRDKDTDSCVITSPLFLSLFLMVSFSLCFTINQDYLHVVTISISVPLYHHQGNTARG